MLERKSSALGAELDAVTRKHETAARELEASQKREAALREEADLLSQQKTEALTRAEAAEEELVGVRSDCESFEAELKWHMAEATRVAEAHQATVNNLHATMQQQKEDYEARLEAQEVAWRQKAEAWRVAKEGLEGELELTKDKLRAS